MNIPEGKTFRGSEPIHIPNGFKDVALKNLFLEAENKNLNAQNKNLNDYSLMLSGVSILALFLATATLDRMSYLNIIVLNLCCGLMLPLVGYKIALPYSRTLLTLLKANLFKIFCILSVVFPYLILIYLIIRA